MKNLSIVLAAVLCGLFTGCTSVQKTDPTTGVVTTVKQVDPAKIQAIRKTLQPGAARAIAKAIARSPQHAPQIRQYASAVSTIFCNMQANNNFFAGLPDGRGQQGHGRHAEEPGQ